MSFSSCIASHPWLSSRIGFNLELDALVFMWKAHATLVMSVQRGDTGLIEVRCDETWQNMEEGEVRVVATYADLLLLLEELAPSEP